MFFLDIKESFKRELSDHWPSTLIRVFIIGWALLVIILALAIENPYVLAGIAAWEVLP